MLAGAGAAAREGWQGGGGGERQAGRLRKPRRGPTGDGIGCRGVTAATCLGLSFVFARHTDPGLSPKGGSGTYRPCAVTHISPPLQVAVASSFPLPNAPAAPMNPDPHHQPPQPPLLASSASTLSKNHSLHSSRLAPSTVKTYINTAPRSYPPFLPPPSPVFHPRPLAHFSIHKRLTYPLFL